MSTWANSLKRRVASKTAGTKAPLSGTTQGRSHAATRIRRLWTRVWHLWRSWMSVRAYVDTVNAAAKMTFACSPESE